MADVDGIKIAERLRFLLRGPPGGDHESLMEAARRLDVDELSLRASTDESHPRPALHILMAFIRAYGVDPAWLVTGEYSGAAHRTAIDADPLSVRATIERLLPPPGPIQ